MKGIFKPVAVLALAVIFLGSCRKCMDCTVLDKYGEVDSGLQDIERCGTGDELEEIEAEYSAYAASIQGSADCVRR